MKKIIKTDLQRSEPARLGEKIEQLEKVAAGLQQAEAAAHASADRFRALLTNISDVVYCMSPDWSEMRQLVGRDFIPDTDTPSRSWLTNYIHPEDQPQVVAAIEEAVRTKRCFELEHRVRRVDGTLGWTFSRAVPMLDTDENIVEWLGIASDVTARKEAEQKLEERSVQLARLTEELTLAEHRERQRVAQHLHDNLQQLLVAARLRIHGLDSLEAPDRAEALASLNVILNEAYTATREVVQDTAPPVPLTRDPVEGFRWLVQEARERHQLEVEPQLEVDEALKRAPEAVGVLLFTAARELLLNITKHADTPFARLRLSHCAETVVLEVCDQGRGVDLSGTRDRPYGFGLLSIQERVELLGGTFSVESAPGHGFRGILTIPLPEAKNTVPASAPPAFTPEKDRACSGKSCATGASQTIRILFVDDHSMVRDSLVYLLQAQPDIEVVGQASNGLEALARAEQLRPDLVVMDIGMPILDGIEATRIMRQRWPFIRIVGLSMFDASERGDRMLKAGADSYVPKSADPGQLLETIRAYAPRTTCPHEPEALGESAGELTTNTN